MKKVVIYTRVSTDDQRDNGFSLQDQERRLRLECAKRGYEVIKHYQDDHSAKDFNRSKFQEFLVDLKSKRIKPNLFFCVRPDRFTRNLVDGILMVRELSKLGVEYETLESHVDLNSPDNLIPFSLHMLMAEVDNKKKGENTKRGMRQAIREGRFPWKAPLGYLNDQTTKTIITDAIKAPLIKLAFETYSRGLHSVDQVRAILKEKGLVTSKQTLINTLRNPLYIGKVHLTAWKDEPEEIIEGLHEPLIDEETFAACVDILNGKKKKLSRLNTRQQNLPLRGFLSCAQCGGKLTGSNSKSRDGSLHSYYHCQRGCKERFRADTANGVFVHFLQGFEVTEEVQELYLKILADVFKTNDADRTRERQHLEGQIEDLNKRIETLTDKYVDGCVDDQTYRESKKRYESKKNDLTAAHISLQPEGAALNNYLRFSTFCSRNLSAFYKRADFECKQQIVGSIFPDNLIFEEKNYRTTRVNEAIELICSVGKAFRQTENKKVGKIADLSSLAPPSGLE